MLRAEVGGLLLLAAACGGGGGADAGGSGDAAGQQCPPDVPPTCYAADPVTDGVGICHAGVPRCEGGEVVECIGAVPPEAEWCDGLDDDCDGETDEQVCRRTCIGLDCERPWGQAPTDFIIGPNGGVALEMADDDAVAVLWVPENNSGTVAKVDTRQRRVVARYQVVPPAAGCPVNEEAIGNVAVDPEGNVYLATYPSRPDPEASLEARLLSVAFIDCPDNDGDGVVESSTGPEDVRPFLEDECVRWHTAFIHHPIVYSTGVAVERHARRTGSDWLIWAASPGFERIWAIDPETGEETGDELFLDEGARARYLDFDGRGVLLAQADSLPGEHKLALIDTQNLTYELVPPPFEHVFGGMIQDHRGRIWTQDALIGYDSGDEEWMVPSFYGHETGKYRLGVTGFVAAPSHVIFGQTWYDTDGNFTGQGSLFTYDIEADDMDVHLDTALPPSSFALDRDGQVWQLEWGPEASAGMDCDAARQPSSAWVWNPWTSERELAIDGELWGSIQFADNPTGVVPLDVLPGPRSAVWSFSGCDPATEGDTLWGALDWDAVPIDHTHIRFEVQGDDDLEWSAEGPWLAAGQDPEDSGPVPLRELVPETRRILHVRATLWGDQLSPPFRSPELLRIEAAFDCPGDVD